MTLVLYRVTDPRGVVAPENVDYQYGQTFFADPRTVGTLLDLSRIAPVPPSPFPLITSNGLTLPAAGLGPVGPPGPPGPVGPVGPGSSETLNNAYTLGNVITITPGHPVTINKSVVDSTTAFVVDVTGGSGLAADITGSVNISGGLSMSNHTIANVLAPSAGTDAATKTYVDTKPAHSLGTSGSPVVVDVASPPSTGQVLTATSTTNATWQTPSGGGGGTLDAAYDFGGAGAGRDIIVDANAIRLLGGNDANNVMEIYKDPGGGVFAGDGLNIFVGTNTTGNGIRVSVGGGSGLAGLFTGASVSIPDSGTNSERLGASAVATGISSTAIGQAARAEQNFVTVVGAEADADQQYAVAIGYQAYAGTSSERSVSVGSLTGSQSFGSIVVGYDTHASTLAADHCVVIGYQSTVDSQRVIAIGSGISLTGGLAPYGIAIGTTAGTFDHGTAVGDNAQVTGQFGVAIGAAASAAQNTVAVGHNAQTPLNNSGNVAVGPNSVAGNAAQIVYPGPGASFDNFAFGDSCQAGTGTGKATENIAVGAFAVAGLTAGTVASDCIAIGDGCAAGSYSPTSPFTYSDCIVIGDGAQAGDDSHDSADCIAIGDGASANGTHDCVAIGDGPFCTVTSFDCVAIGDGPQCDGSNSIAIGNGPLARGTEVIALGHLAKTDNGATEAIAIGHSAEVNGAFNDAVAVGHGATVTGSNSVSIGRSSLGASSAAAGEVALMNGDFNFKVGTINGVQFGASSSVKMGWFGAAPITQPSVTGSRGGNAALASLLVQLASLGLIVDNTVA